jgi:hypothetical protein
MCPAAYYCAGGKELRAGCPDGTYAPPGANSSSACGAAVFVVVIAALPLASVEFAAPQQELFQEAVAAAAGVAPAYVSLSVSSTIRRAAGASIQVREMPFHTAEPSSYRKCGCWLGSREFRAAGNLDLLETVFVLRVSLLSFCYRGWMISRKPGPARTKNRARDRSLYSRSVLSLA